MCKGLIAAGRHERNGHAADRFAANLNNTGYRNGCTT